MLYLYCFQSWCPGCHSRGFPTLKTLTDYYQGDEDVAFVTVQTVFEGFSTNTVDAAWQTARRYKLSIPVGHDGAGGDRSKLMGRYRSGGTPWTIVIDRQGRVAYNGFHIQPAQAQTLIDELKMRPGELPALSFDRWPVPETAKSQPNRVTLYRWWTGDDAGNEDLVELERLRETWASRGLRVIAVHHRRGTAPSVDAVIREHATAAGYRGPIALDEDGSELQRVMRTARATPTGVSVLVNRKGMISLITRPSGDPAALEAALRAFLPDKKKE